MLGAFLKALGQLPDPAFRRVVARGVGLTVAVFVAVIVGLPFLLLNVPVTDIPYLEELAALGIVAFVVVAFFLAFPAVATLFISIYLDDIVDAVDAKHYPDQPPARGLTVVESIMVSARFSGLVLVVNLVVLPLYLLLIFFPPINLFFFWTLNGYLFSREYYELVALRRLERGVARRLRRANRGRLFLAGVLIAVLFSIPIVNIITPVVAAAFVAHLFRSLEPERVG